MEKGGTYRGEKRKTQVKYLESGISKELECLQCHYPAERKEKKRFPVQEFKLSFFQWKVLSLVHRTISQAVCW